MKKSDGDGSWGYGGDDGRRNLWELRSFGKEKLEA
jgi:hypothetical protein